MYENFQKEIGIEVKYQLDNIAKDNKRKEDIKKLLMKKMQEIKENAEKQHDISKQVALQSAYKNRGPDMIMTIINISKKSKLEE